MNKKLRISRHTSLAEGLGMEMKMGRKFNYRTLLKKRGNFTNDNLQKLGAQDIINKKDMTSEISKDNLTQTSMKQFITTLRKSPMPIQKNLKNNDNKSFSSSKSSRIVYSRALERASYQELEQQVQNQTQLPQFSLLEIYEKRVEELLKIKLLKKFKNHHLLNARIQEDQIEKELKDIIHALKNYESMANQLSEEGQKNSIDLQQIDRIIILFEKIIAGSYSESEMLKKYYYAKKCQKVKSQCRKQNSKLYMSCQNFGKIFYQDQNKIKSPYLHLETESQKNFVKPNPNYYQPRKYKQNTYISNRQSLPKSTYQKQFFDYGSMQIYNHRKSDNFLSTSSIHQNRFTTYQGDFNQKRVPLFDSTNLDCRKDKFKADKILFMGKEYSTAPQNLKPVLKKRCKQNVKSLQINLSNSEKTSVKLSNKTEFKSQYQGQKLSIQSFIKDKNLSNLKYCYTNQIQT